MRAEDILYFWFTECSPKDWFKKNVDFDALLSRRFGSIHKAAADGELYHWRSTGKGRLAEIILLDQFSRNMFRDTAQMFAYDLMALTLAQEAVRLKVEVNWDHTMKAFLYMPYMHSESAVIHNQAIELFSEDPALASNLDFEMRHKAIIDKFGRYPHRNAVLSRKSTVEEIDFLKEPASGF